MTDRKPAFDYRLFAATAVALTGSAVFGLVFALLPRPTGISFAYQFVVFTTPMAAIMLGDVIGRVIENYRRQRIPARLWLGVAAVAIAVGLSCYLIGRYVTPTLGRLETPILFPGLYLIGLASGCFGSKIPKFQPDTKRRERTSHKIVIEIVEPRSDQVTLFRRWLCEHYAVETEDTQSDAIRMNVAFEGVKNLRRGIARIRKAAHQHSLTDVVHIVQP